MFLDVPKLELGNDYYRLRSTAYLLNSTTGTAITGIVPKLQLGNVDNT